MWVLSFYNYNFILTNVIPKQQQKNSPVMNCNTEIVIYLNYKRYTVSCVYMQVMGKLTEILHKYETTLYFYTFDIWN